MRSEAPAWLDSPEFKEAVAKAAVDVATQLMAAQQSAPATVPEDGLGNDRNFVRQLAMAIAEVSDQGTDRKRVAPEILAAREDGKRRMFDLLIEARANGETPLYELRHKVQLPYGDKGETVFEPLYQGTDKRHYPTQIQWGGVPNLAMVGVNDSARRIMEAFHVWIGNSGPEMGSQQLKLTPGGVVLVSGPMVTDRAEVGGPEGWRPDAAVIRNHEPGERKLINVLGTIARPVEQNA